MIKIAANDHFQNFLLGIILLNGRAWPQPHPSLTPA